MAWQQQRHRWSAEKRRSELYAILLQRLGWCDDWGQSYTLQPCGTPYANTDGNSDSNRLAQRLLRPRGLGHGDAWPAASLSRRWMH